MEARKKILAIWLAVIAHFQSDFTLDPVVMIRIVRHPLAQCSTIVTKTKQYLDEAFEEAPLPFAPSLAAGQGTHSEDPLAFIAVEKFEADSSLTAISESSIACSMVGEIFIKGTDFAIKVAVIGTSSMRFFDSGAPVGFVQEASFGTGRFMIAMAATRVRIGGCHASVSAEEAAIDRIIIITILLQLAVKIGHFCRVFLVFNSNSIIIMANSVVVY